MSDWKTSLAEPLQRSKLWELLFTGDFTKNWVAKEAFLRALKRRLADCVLDRLVVVIGENPFQEKELAALLRHLNIKAVATEHESATAPVFQHSERIIICVGASYASGFSVRRVRMPIGWRDGQHLASKFVQIRRNASAAEGCCRSVEDVKLCTQENLFAWLVTGREPSDADALTERGYQKSFLFEDTPLLNLMDLASFPWPKTDAAPSALTTDAVSMVEYSDGLLRYLGYRVGKQGASVQRRREILEGAFLSQHLPQVNSNEYTAEWGNADSAKRLKKMANFIATECRNAKRQKHADFSAAIADWESDFNWLKSKFYTGRFDQSFGWPTV